MGGKFVVGVRSHRMNTEKGSIPATVAIVTGGESGIGAACARAFGAAGRAVAILFHVDEAAAEAVAQDVAAAGGSALTQRCDVRDEAAVDAAFLACESALGVADVLVNSAGINQRGVAVRDMALDQWRQMIATDLTGAFLTSRRFIRARRTAGGAGSIIHISSIHAEVVRAGAADYCAAKGGLTRLVETLALEEAAVGIRINAIEPGMILTPMNARAVADADFRATLEANIPAGRAGTAEEVAGLALWLASPAAAYITGASIPIDGGLSLLLGQGA